MTPESGGTANLKGENSNFNDIYDSFINIRTNHQTAIVEKSGFSSLCADATTFQVVQLKNTGSAHDVTGSRAIHHHD